MKRLHIHISVDELSESIKFYSTIFNASPTVQHQDYAKWDLIEPAVNFAISNRGHKKGLNHLGIQVDSESALMAIADQLDNAAITSSKQVDTSCCYAESNKHWAVDPQGIAWEAFHTLKEIQTFSGEANTDSADKTAACCLLPSRLEPARKEDRECCVPSVSDATGCCS